MAKAAGYKQIKTNKDIGGYTHGSFKMSGNKKGNQGTRTDAGSQKGLKKSKETLANMDAHTFMKKTIKGMRADGTKLRRINMLPNTGAFH